MFKKLSEKNVNTNVLKNSVTEGGKRKLINPLLIDPIVRDDEERGYRLKVRVNPIVIDKPKPATDENPSRNIGNPPVTVAKASLNMISNNPLQNQSEQPRALSSALNMIKPENLIGNPASGSPYYIAEKFLKKVKMIVKSERVFVFNSVFYEEKSVKDLCRLVLHLFRSQIASEGKPKFVDEIVDFLIKEPSILLQEDNLDFHSVAFQNCVLNTQNGLVSAHGPNFLLFYSINANYLNFAAHPPLYFDIFLARISGNDAMLCRRIWEMIGYVLTPDLGGKCLFLLQGVQNSGKSVLCSFIYRLFSKNAVITLDAHDLGREFIVSELAEKALCLSPDLPAEALDSKATSKLKQLTGADEVSSNVKYQKYTRFVSRAKIILATNHPLLTKKSDAAFFERVVTIPFSFSIPKEERDPEILPKLMAEKDAIVSKAMGAYFSLKQNAYRFSGEFPINAVTADNIESSESIEMKIFHFIRENFHADNNGIVFTNDAYEGFLAQIADITLNDFVANFSKVVSGMFEVKKSRKRKPGAENATSCFLGISWNSLNT